MATLLIATRNAHKVAEIRAILGGQFKFRTLKDFPAAPKVVEDADTFAGNATKKAVELAKWLATDARCPTPGAAVFVLADDSGLEVGALNGAPGVHSARFAAPGQNENSQDADNNARLLHLLKDVPPKKRTARFRCVMALAQVENTMYEIQNPKLFDGACAGKILFEPRGWNGFGYDPLFVPDGFEQTFAELGEGVKNKLSHRAKALEKLKSYFSKLPS